MTRWLPWQTVIPFGGIGLLITILCILPVFFVQVWHTAGTVLLVIVPITSWMIIAMCVWTLHREGPRFYSYNAAIWTNELMISSIDVGKAIEHFIWHAAEPLGVTRDVLQDIFWNARIEFVADKFWYGEKQYAGLQKGNAMKVAWLGGFHKNAFFHECMHMAHELLQGKIDYKHLLMNDWDAVAKIKQSYRS